jgi:hypothetical protein
MFELNKGGICWLDGSLSRGKEGLEISIKTVPEIELFMKSLGSKEDAVEAYGKSWISLNGQPLMIHRMDKDIFDNEPGANRTYDISRIAEPMISPRDGRVNLSFLRIVGISNPDGVRFGIKGPISSRYISDLKGDILRETKNFLRDFIVPVQYNIRVSSQEG